MSDFNTLPLTQKALDPRKKVKYTTGLVLGVDEFNQEQHYLLEKDRGHNRALHGYGTVNGLRVTVEMRNGGQEVLVSPGRAVDRCGREICISTTQCAQINTWLARHREEILGRLSPPGGFDISPPGAPDLSPPCAPSLSPPCDLDLLPPGDVALYVVLCYSECETDKVPIPGGPCRSEKDSVAASRIADNFKLSLQTAPPPQPETVADRRLASTLKLIEATDDCEVILNSCEIGDLVKWLLEIVQDGLASLPISFPPRPAMLEPGLEALLRKIGRIAPDIPLMNRPFLSRRWDRTLYLHESQVCRILQLLFRTWTTEIRPALIGGSGCLSAPCDDGCILLAKLTFDFDAATMMVNGEVRVDDTLRPYLLTTAMLQEIVLCAGLGHHTPDGPAGGDLTGFYPNPVIAQGAVTSDKIADETIVNADVSPAAAIAYSKLNLNNSIVTGDLVDGSVTTPKLADGAVTDAKVANGISYSKLAGAPTSLPPNGPAGGDLSGTYPNPTIANSAVTDAKVANGISYSKLVGVPTSLPPNGPAGGDLTGTYPNPTIANGAITTPKLADGAVTLPKISTAGAAVGETIVFNGAGLAWGNAGTSLVGAGHFDRNGVRLGPVLNELGVEVFLKDTDLFLLIPAGYNSKAVSDGTVSYIVTGTSQVLRFDMFPRLLDWTPEKISSLVTDMDRAIFEFICYVKEGIVVRSGVGRTPAPFHVQVLIATGPPPPVSPPLPRSGSVALPSPATGERATSKTRKSS